ncbi:MAG: PD40 domain-containing protein [Armatimonadetes bacterium]|nr:PD40 domain-containing protein [Armatimonadota bacterium]
MPPVVDLAAPVRRLSPGHGHYFFGYYDIPAIDPACRRQLCHRVAFRDRFPRPDDVAELGLLQLDSAAGGFEPFGETLAWNFQQGSMLQWLPGGGSVLYNTFEDGAYGACVHELTSGARRRLPRPVANVSQDGRRAVCINMSRVFDFRPGYGYEELPDPHYDVAAPADDGVWTMDLASGETHFVVSYEQLAALLNADGARLEGAKIVINHITFNPTGDRFLMLVRNFAGAGQPWLTFLLTSDLDGRDIRNHAAYGMASHYHWRNDREMLFWMNTCPEKRSALVLVDDESGTLTAVDEGFFRHDGHCSYSPDGDWILYDSYPDGSTADHFRTLFVYAVPRGEGVVLGRFRSEAHVRDRIDLRCDLHPRWAPDGRTITFDSIHEGYRGVYAMDLSGVVG